MKSIKKWIRVPAVCLAAVVSVRGQAPELSTPQPEPAQRFITEKVELENHTFLPYLVYVGRNVKAGQPAPAVFFLTDRMETLRQLQEEWTLGERPTLDSCLTILPAQPADALYRSQGAARVLAVVEDVEKKFSADPNRLYLWGAGRGGELAGWLTRGHPDRFAGLAIQFGWDPQVVDLIEFQQMSPARQNHIIREYPLTYIPNMTHMGCVLITGAYDPGMGAALMAGQALQRAGGLCRTLWLDADPAKDPSLWFPTAEAADLLQAYRRVPPSHRHSIRFRIDRLRHNRSGWVTVHDKESWYAISDIDIGYAEAQEGELLCQTVNVRTFEIQPPQPAHHIRIDGERLPCAAQGASVYQRRKGHWQPIDPVAVIVTEKYADRAGPIEDVFSKPFVFVYGTRDILREQALKSWAESTAAEPVFRSADLFGQRPTVKVLSDRAVLEHKALQESHNLICFGGAEVNEISRLLNGRYRPKKEASRIDGPALLTCIQPSPFSFRHYVVVQEALNEKAMEAPARLNWSSDWILYRPGGGALVGGFYDKQWDLQDPPEHP